MRRRKKMSRQFVIYSFKNIKIKIDSRIFYTDIQEKMILTIEKVLRIVPYRIYNEALSTIVIGENRFVPNNSSSVFYKNVIFISPYFLTTESPISLLTKILIHELGHAFVAGWKTNLQNSGESFSDYQNFLEFVASKVPESEQVLLQSGGSYVEKKQKIEKFIQNYGENELKALLFRHIRSPYALTSLDEFIAYNFEEFFLGDTELVKKTAPSLYALLMKITNGQV